MNYIVNIFLLICVVCSQTANTKYIANEKYFNFAVSNNYDNIKTLSENIKFNNAKLSNNKIIKLNDPILSSNYNNIKIFPKYNIPSSIESFGKVTNKNWYNNIKLQNIGTKPLNNILNNKYSKNKIDIYINKDFDLSIIKDVSKCINQLSRKKKLRKIKILKSKNRNIKPKKINNKNISITELIKQVESRKNIPSGLLRAIGIVESKLQPYVINYHGRGYSFKTKNEATNFANSLIRRGETNFSVGCFQLHYKSHARRFSSVSDMFEPSKNIEYAAKLLNQLYKNNGYKWSNAIKRYHSNIDSCNNRYYSKIVTKLGKHI